jgi:DNA-binding NarL/FixJ family response regulator
MKRKEKQKRRMDRFALELPSLILAGDKKGRQNFLQLRTDNICAGGAYFKTENPLPAGAKVKLEIGLEDANKPKQKNVIVRVCGTVIRVDDEGMAVAFEKQYRMISFPGQKAVVHIVGPNKLQNRLLGSFLERDRGWQCRYAARLNPEMILDDAQPFQSGLVLWDYPGVKRCPGLLWNGSDFWPRCFFALFNVGSDKAFERKVLTKGIRGLFYHDDPPEIFPKGISAILKGGLWYGGKAIIPEAGLKFDEPEASPICAILTPREKEILKELGSGKTNQEIANNLFISVCTVKSHLYTVYKKIGIPNRLQASLWVRKNLRCAD